MGLLFNVAAPDDTGRVSLHQLIVDRIGQRIVSGEISAGTVLPKEEQIAAEFGTSRSVVREGMKILAAKGLVRARQKRGTTVEPSSRWNLFDPEILSWWPRSTLKRDFGMAFMDLRMAIEPKAAELAAINRSPADSEALKHAYVDMISAKTPREFTVADVAFHRILFAASGNPLIAQLAHIIEPLFAAVIDREEPNVPPASERSVALHGELADAVDRRNPARARKATEQLLRITMLIFIKKGEDAAGGRSEIVP
jgi:DNA-binding FadR family transcriptional regulator